MAVKFDILDYLVRPGAFNPRVRGKDGFEVQDRPCGGASSLHPETFWDFRLTGDAGEWLRARGHRGEFRVYQDRDGAELIIEDDEMAMLFKLTWL